MRIPRDAPTIAVIFTGPTGNGNGTHTTTTSGEPPSTPGLVAWFEAIHRPDYSVVLVDVYRSAAGAATARRILSRAYDVACSRRNNVVECDAAFARSARPWLTHARRALGHV